MTTYSECLTTMYGLRRFGIILDLSTIRNILKELGNPQDRFAAVHVAGTNGKGSVSATLSAVLQAAGYKVGLYTSPHLVRFNERICIDNAPISDDQVVEACRVVRSVPFGDREPTFFEYSTAMAFHAFAENRVDWAVVETGMGGRLDATNVILPKLSIITNISLEHQMYLGKTIAQIAGEKGGIIKDGVPVVTGASQKEAVSVLTSIAASRSAPMFRHRDAFRVRRQPDGTFTYYGFETVLRGLKTALAGSHQIENAALVLAASEILALPEEAIRRGLTAAKWPGRLEAIGNAPLVLLDGAHNLDGARTLKRYLTERLSSRGITLVVGILNDKPYRAMLKALLPGCRRVIITRAKIDRALPPETLYGIAREIVPDTCLIPNVADAVKHALKTTLPKDAVVVAGSLYVVGEAKEYFETRVDRFEAIH